jgi:hypothetical protein
MSTRAALRRALLLHPALLACLGGCGSSAEEEPAPVDQNIGPDEPGPSEEGWETLISGEWSLPPGEEGYTCARVTVPESMYVSAFEAINPVGTHHTLLTVGEPDEPDGITPCNAGENRTLSVFGSGVGTDPLAFPEGVALYLEQGTQLLLNLHLFNTSGETMTGVSGTRIKRMEEADVQHVAEGVLAGTIGLDIPAGQTTEHVGHCTMTSDVTLFAVAPHMHQLGIHEKVFAESAAGETTLFDAPYSFDEQSYHLVSPVSLAKGDRVRIECTHRNTTSERVTFGESTLSEMCFAGLYMYPSDGGLFVCVDY